MSIANDLREHVIQPLLYSLPSNYQVMNSHEAVTLLLGTALAESGGTAIAQMGGGPAAGICQMEEATHADIWENWLLRDKHQELLEWIAERFGDTTYDEERFSRLYGDASYAFFMARCHYYRVAEAIPAPASGDIKPFARYWKKYYNTHLGAGTIEHFIDSWEAMVG